MIAIVHREDARSCVQASVLGEQGLYAVVEAPVSEGVDIEALAALLASVVRTRCSWKPGMTSAIAGALDLELRQADGRSRLPGWVFYGAVFATPTAVEACVAGPHRVHLVRDGKIQASTREHVLRHDAPPPDWTPDMLAGVDLELHGGVVTRSLGKVVSRPAETTLWTLDVPYRVVVCSSDAIQNSESEVCALCADENTGLLDQAGIQGSVCVLTAR